MMPSSEFDYLIIEDSYMRGFRARYDGVDMHDNPHQEGTHDYCEWDDGWFDAHFEIGDLD